MEKYFNVSGVCDPDIHYMVDLTDRLVQIRAMIEKGFYFMINRARQYGKTTTLEALRKFLEKEYLIFSVSFAELGEASFQTEEKFCRSFVRLLSYTAQDDLAGTAGDLWLREFGDAEQITDLLSLSRMISGLCTDAGSPVVLMIDEVDSASNNQVFLDFLAMLRSKYLKKSRSVTFQSVILAGVYDIKNLKLRMRPDAEHKYNSPWNIAEDFTIDMNFSRSDIAGMLTVYEHDHHVGMDVEAAAETIYEFTGGYPFLVSRMCKLADEIVPDSPGFPDRASAWREVGLLRALKILTEERNMLLDDMIKKISDHRDLDTVLRNILLDGMEYPYSALDNAIQLGTVFGILKRKDGMVAVANQVFETALYNYYILEQMRKNPDSTYGGELQRFVKHGELDLCEVLLAFQDSVKENWREEQEQFLEENGRFLFLVFLKPIINGNGFCYVEAQTRSRKRTDVIIQYNAKRYIIEMKIWHGEEYNRKGEEQLFGYLDEFGEKTGYLLSFNFNKKKEYSVKKRQYRDKLIFEVTV